MVALLEDDSAGVPLPPIAQLYAGRNGMRCTT